MKKLKFSFSKVGQNGPIGPLAMLKIFIQIFFFIKGDTKLMLRSFESKRIFRKTDKPGAQVNIKECIFFSSLLTGSWSNLFTLFFFLRIIF